jgi:hypothetical protein
MDEKDHVKSIQMTRNSVSGGGGRYDAAFLLNARRGRMLNGAAPAQSCRS